MINAKPSVQCIGQSVVNDHAADSDKEHQREGVKCSHDA